jgi:hypothetical protein
MHTKTNNNTFYPLILKIPIKIILIPIDIYPIKKLSFLGVRDITDGPEIAPKNPQIPTM